MSRPDMVSPHHIPKNHVPEDLQQSVDEIGIGLKVGPNGEIMPPNLSYPPTRTDKEIMIKSLSTDEKEKICHLARAYIEEYKNIIEQIKIIKAEQVKKVDFRGVETKYPPIPEELVKKEQEIFVYFASHTEKLKSAGLSDLLDEFRDIRS